MCYRVVAPLTACVYIHTHTQYVCIHVYILQQRCRVRVPFVIYFCHELGVDSDVFAVATCRLLDDVYCVLSVIY